MGKQAGPTPEELEFIFGCFARGLSNSEVLEEMKDTEFPVRNPRFISARRREFNAAKKVLEISLKKEIDPIIVEAKQKHYADLLEVANSLLKNEVISVRKNNWEAKPMNPYIINSEDGMKSIDKKDLGRRLAMNLEDAYIYHGTGKVDCFISHFQSEFTSNKTFAKRIQTEPYKVINMCMLLSNRKTFKGLCAICEGW